MRNIVFTDHALKRLQEYKIPVEKAKSKLRSARRCRRSFSREAEKFNRYGAKQIYVDYYYSTPLLFTVDVRDDSFLCVTITWRKRKGIKFAK